MHRYSNCEIKFALNRLKNFQQKLSYEELVIDLDGYIERLPISITTFPEIPLFNETQPRNKKLLYRARPNEKIDLLKSTLALPFNTLEEISLNLKIELIKRGRLNKANQSIFYCSNSVMGACFEAISKGFFMDKAHYSMGLTVGIWKMVEPLELASLYYSTSGLDFFQKNDMQLYSKKLDYRNAVREKAMGRIQHDLKANADELDLNMFLLDFFSDELGRIDIENENDYKLSNYYAEHVFERVPQGEIDGIFYPSIPMAFQGDNIALHPRALKKLQFVSAMNVWAVYHEETRNLQIIPLKQNIPADTNGLFHWS